MKIDLFLYLIIFALVIVSCGDASNTSVPPNNPPVEIRYLDNDGDGFGDPSAATINFNSSPDYVTNQTDCNDSDPSVYPNARDFQGDGIDQNCDGILDNPTFPVSLEQSELFPIIKKPDSITFF